MSTLIVLLPPPRSADADEYGYVLSADGHTAASDASAPAALLPRATGAGAEVVAVVPAAALSWQQVELPRGTGTGSPRLRAVLEGLLEERLLDEPDTLHFALAPQARAGAPVWVAVCDRAWLRAAVQALESAQRPVSRIVPEFAPDMEPALYVSGDPQAAQLVATGAGAPAVMPFTATALPLLGAELPVVAEPAVAAMAEQLLQRPVTLQQHATRWLRASQSPWDLAQFDLANSNRTRALRKLATAAVGLLRAPQWRAARWGALVLVAANLVGLNAWAWKERSALAAKRDALRSTLTTTFPNVKVVVDAPIQMQRELDLLRQGTGGTSGRDLEVMLGAAAAALPPGRTPGGIEFAPGEIRLKGLGDTAGALGTSLRPQGYSARGEGDTLVVRQEAAR